MTDAILYLLTSYFYDNMLMNSLNTTALLIILSWSHYICFPSIQVGSFLSPWILVSGILMQITVYTSEHFFLTPPIVNGSTELRRVEVATVLGREEGHTFQYFPGESNKSVWPGMNY